MIPTNWIPILYKDEIQNRINKLGKLIDNKFVGQDIVICSILKGAAYFTVDLSRAMKLPHSVYFVEASSYEGQTQSDEVEMLSLLEPSKFKGRHVLLVDELFDNGKTIHTVKKLLLSKNLGIKTIITCVLFKKGKVTSYAQPDIVGFDDMLDVWYVGWGLDDNGLLRNLTDLWAVPKIEGIPKSHDDRRIFGYDGEAFIDNHRNFLLKGISDRCDACRTRELPGGGTGCSMGDCLVCEDCMCPRCENGDCCEKHCGCQSVCFHCEEDISVECDKNISCEDCPVCKTCICKCDSCPDHCECHLI